MRAMKYASVSLLMMPCSTASFTTSQPLSVPTCDVQQLPVALLVFAREQRQHQVRHLRELRVTLVVRVAEMLDLRHRELSHAQQTRTRGDLVAEPRSHLRRREGELAPVVVQQAAVVHEHALRRLRTQEALQRALRTDQRREHQVERERMRQRVARRQRRHAVLREQLVQLVCRVRVRLQTDVFQLQALLLRQRHVLHQLVHLRLQQLLGKKDPSPRLRPHGSTRPSCYPSPSGR